MTESKNITTGIYFKNLQVVKRLLSGLIEIIVLTYLELGGISFA